MEFEHVDADCRCDGKQCKDCGGVKCVGDFPIRNRNGYRSRYCRPCLNQRKYAWVEANRDKARASRKNYSQTNERIKQIRRENALKWNSAHPEVLRERKMKREFNISTEEYAAMLEQQGGVCAICHKSETAKSRAGNVYRLAVDHDHITGKVRGLLCFKCNTNLGVWENNAAAFMSYLSQSDNSCSE